MASNISSIISQMILLITTLLVFISCSTASPFPFKKIYAFGDSYTDTGNTKTSTGPTAFNYVSNPPYGETFFHHPTNRYSDGRIIIDFVAEALSLPFVPPYRDTKADQSHGVNFAVGGATAIRHGYFLKNNVTFNLVPQSLQTQLVWFNKILDLNLGDALFWVGEIGANDYTCTIGSSIPKKTIQAIAIKSTIGFLQALLHKGAKYIVVQGLPMSGCITYSFALSSSQDRDQMGCVASMNQIAQTHNAILQSKLDALRKQYPKSVIVYFDFFHAHFTIFKNAKKYGFRQQYKACCGYGGGEYNYDVFNPCGSPSSSSCANPFQYINWDGAHFTEAVYQVMTREILNGSYCTPPFPYLLKNKIMSS
ncbi:hypothetical protein RD792_008796 [Penstemon davidsonii]|uniref:Uncharacterized protein n=1 Tax=Penstemon davidsonii TaxID=160366 RepID=A0ABR0DBQ4_9LAMI|nr:hypothetical protein RD792_008796 [Penstemon davidsonii]